MSVRSTNSVLIVEDDFGDACLLREMLREDLGLRAAPVLAGTMREAERLLSEDGFAAILLDLDLPDAKGLAAIRRVRAAAPASPLVVMAGADDGVLAEQSLREGAQDHLVKGQVDARELLRALRHAVERKRLEWLKDEMLSYASHELRTPLTSIVASLGLLIGTMHGILPAAAARLVQVAHTNSQRLIRIVNDILDVQKLEAGKVTFELERVDVRSLAEQAIDANREFSAGHHVRVRIGGVADPVAMVRADGGRLFQAIGNLMSNAIKFSPAGGEVAVAVETDGDLVRISVRDHGPGIAAEFKPRVFERFAQADATRMRRADGAGLGLSIVKQIVTGLGGTVGFADAAGGGTIFHIELPRWGGKADLANVARNEVAASARTELPLASDGIGRETA